MVIVRLTPLLQFGHQKLKGIHIWTIFLLVAICLCLALFQIFTPVHAQNIQHAQSIPSRTISIRQTATGHLYFAPTYPACVRGNVVQVKLINTSKQVVRFIYNTDGGKPVSVKPNGTLIANVKVEEVQQETYPGTQTYLPGTFQAKVIMVEPPGDAFADVVAIMLVS